MSGLQLTVNHARFRQLQRVLLHEWRRRTRRRCVGLQMKTKMFMFLKNFQVVVTLLPPFPPAASAAPVTSDRAYSPHSTRPGCPSSGSPAACSTGTSCTFGTFCARPAAPARASPGWFRRRCPPRRGLVRRSVRRATGEWRRPVGARAVREELGCCCRCPSWWAD